MNQEQLQAYVNESMASENVAIDFNFKIKGFNHKKPKTLPIIINSFNRLECLKSLIERLKTMGYENIYVIDNKSTYKPLLAYYKESKVNVFYLNKNVGYLSIWKTPIHKYFISNMYAYTDPDVIPVEECPDDFVEYFINLNKKYPQAGKVGFGLKLDDLPEHYKLKQDVINHESGFWVNEIEPEVYMSNIDTTFAVYKSGKIGGWWIPALRTGGNYIARHLGWYMDSENPTEEDIFYKNTITQSTHWSKQ